MGIEMDIAKIQNEYGKESKTLEAKNKAMFDSMKKCKDCKETEFKFFPCQKHLTEMKSIGEEMGNLKMHYSLKMAMHEDEVKKAMEEAMKKQIQALACKDKSCKTCRQ